MLLADKRSANTRRAYQTDLRAFFLAMYDREPSTELIRHFLALSTPQMAEVILRYKAQLLAAQRAEATINRKLSAIRSLVKFARRVGATEADPDDHLDTEKVVIYRDTRGLTKEQARQLLRQPDRNSLKGRRDYALLLLLLENALRRSEALEVTLRDLNTERKTLAIRGKGRGTQREYITLSAASFAAIQSYLALRQPAPTPDAPLFISVSPNSTGKPLTPDGLYKIVREYATQAGLQTLLSPHRLRHTAITLALDAAGGDIRRVQRLSRHAKLETLQIYDDNRTDLQGEVTEMLSALLAPEAPEERNTP